ncbi:MAG: hypothetical protein HYR85_08175 [Planctomycetes bacterium]|nr:hypothetical protein [Planctomycetota bacterium]MBI3843236.1 hypothetical protein [Planctomycetota bacterium]
MNAKATKTTKNARSGQKPNPQAQPQAAPDPTNEQSANPSAPDAPVAPESAQVSKRGKRPKDGNATLAELTAAFLRHLEEAGKSAGTIFSYSMDLKSATEHFGQDTLASTLTPQKVANFFASDAVTLKRNGKKRSSITIAKTRRVFRLALVWAAEHGMIEKAPIPADEMEHARGAAKAETKATVKPARAKKATPKSAKTVEAPAAEPAPEPATATPAE